MIYLDDSGSTTLVLESRGLVAKVVRVFHEQHIAVGQGLTDFGEERDGLYATVVLRVRNKIEQSINLTVTDNRSLVTDRSELRLVFTGQYEMFVAALSEILDFEESKVHGGVILRPKNGSFLGVITCSITEVV